MSKNQKSPKREKKEHVMLSRTTHDFISLNLSELCLLHCKRKKAQVKSPLVLFVLLKKR